MTVARMHQALRVAWYVLYLSGMAAAALFNTPWIVPSLCLAFLTGITRLAACERHDGPEMPCPQEAAPTPRVRLIRDAWYSDPPTPSVH